MDIDRGTLERWNAEILNYNANHEECWNAGTLERWNVGILAMRPGTLERWNVITMFGQGVR